MSSCNLIHPASLAPTAILMDGWMILQWIFMASKLKGQFTLRWRSAPVDEEFQLKTSFTLEFSKGQVFSLKVAQEI